MYLYLYAAVETITNESLGQCHFHLCAVICSPLSSQTLSLSVCKISHIEPRCGLTQFQKRRNVHSNDLSSRGLRICFPHQHRMVMRIDRWGLIQHPLGGAHCLASLVRSIRRARSASLTRKRRGLFARSCSISDRSLSGCPPATKWRPTTCSKRPRPCREALFSPAAPCTTGNWAIIPASHLMEVHAIPSALELGAFTRSGARYEAFPSSVGLQRGANDEREGNRFRPVC